MRTELATRPIPALSGALAPKLAAYCQSPFGHDSSVAWGAVMSNQGVGAWLKSGATVGTATMSLEDIGAAFKRLRAVAFGIATSEAQSEPDGGRAVPPRREESNRSDLVGPFRGRNRAVERGTGPAPEQ
jgi:hypothetical protein